jgi:hypothetical protein
MLCKEVAERARFREVFADRLVCDSVLLLASTQEEFAIMRDSTGSEPEVSAEWRGHRVDMYNPLMHNFIHLTILTGW